jgi:HPt (histidine-containing phosphotransfer) domain-containing protein
MTASTFAEDRAACEAAGMTDFLSKPVDPAALEAVLGRWLPAPEEAREGSLREVPARPDSSSRRRPDAPTDPGQPTDPLGRRGQPPTDPPSRRGQPPTDPPSRRGQPPTDPLSRRGQPPTDPLAALRAIPGFDVDAGLSRLGDVERYTELLLRFVTTSGESLVALRRALDGRDFATARRLAHTLKGAAANLGAVALAAEAAAVEESARREASIATDRISDAFERLRRAARELPRPPSHDGLAKSAELLSGFSEGLSPAPPPRGMKPRGAPSHEPSLTSFAARRPVGRLAKSAELPVSTSGERTDETERVIAELVALVARSDTAALSLVREHRDALRRALGEARARELEDALAEYEFERARQALLGRPTR